MILFIAWLFIIWNNKWNNFHAEEIHNKHKIHVKLFYY